MQTELTVTVLPNPKRRHATDLIVRSSTGMIVACNNWQVALRLLEDAPKVTVRVAQPLTSLVLNPFTVTRLSQE
jgi:hypothetical protein